MARGINYSGLVIAGIGFVLTRFTVTLALYEDPVRFYLAGVVPLALGLGLTAFGVALTVADIDTRVVRTTAAWCVVGLATMVMVVVLTVLGSTAGSGMGMTRAFSQTYLSNFLIVGSIGGTLTGLYAAQHRRERRRVQQQANTLVILNRLLRHEVLNALTAIRGYALMDDDQTRDVDAVIEDRTDSIVETIDEVKYLTRHSGPGTTDQGPVELDNTLATSIDTVEHRYPAASVTVDDAPDDLAVEADDQLATVFTHLLENAVVHGQDPSPTVTVTATRARVRVAITDTGPGLPANQRSLLETGTIEEFDDPAAGFGLNLVRLFVDKYDGDIETTVDDAGTTVTITLNRTTPTGQAFDGTALDLLSTRPAVPHLAVAVVASLVAGVAYGLVSEALGGSVAAIGVFYGEVDPVVGWLTHEFHSVVFGFVYVGLLAVAPPWVGDGHRRFLTVAIAWSLILWAGAAGIVAPIWLQLVGIPADVPTLSGTLLANHLAWGLTLSACTALGYRYVLPSR